LVTVPEIPTGVFTVREIVSLLKDRSAFGTAKREGFYIRREAGDWLEARAKGAGQHVTS
jgi:hypothetical protein